MGNNNSDITEAEFRQDWKPIQTKDDFVIWQNKRNQDQRLAQYRAEHHNLDHSQKLSHIRKNNPYIVNAFTLKGQGFACNIDHEHEKILVEVIRLRLSEVEHIPYPDVLHLYKACLSGYLQLANLVGYFTVDEDMVGINEKGQVKCWLNTYFHSDKVGGLKVTEFQMVRQLLTLLNSKINHDTCGRYTNISWYIGNHEKITFREALNKFEQYTKEFNEGRTPDRLNCVVESGGVGNIKEWIRGNDVGERRVEERVEVRPESVGRVEEVRVIDSQRPVHFSHVSSVAPRKIERAPVVEERISSQRMIESNRREGSGVRQVNRSFVREERPLIVRQERPVMIREERPIIREERPVMVRSERPVVREERPIMVRSERPVVREERPVVREERPVIVRQERPAMVRSVGPIVRQERPVVMETNTVVRQQRPVAVRQERPVIRSELPVIVEERSVREGKHRGEESSVVIQEKRPVFVSSQVPQRQLPRGNAVQFNNGPSVPASTFVAAPQANPIKVPRAVSMPLAAAEIRRVESIQVGRPMPIVIQPQATKPLSMQKRVSNPTPIATFNEKPRLVEKASLPVSSLTNPPQVVDSISWTRPVEQPQRSETQTILQNLQSNFMKTEKQENSYVTSPSAYNDNKLQQERVISQVYEVNGDKEESSLKVKELKGSDVVWQDYNKKDSFDNLEQRSRPVPHSFGLEEQNKFSYKKQESAKYAPAQDGKSSPQFLAFLTEIRSGSNSNVTQSNSRVNSNPSYLAENQNLGAVSNPSKLYGQTETYSHQSISGGYGQTSNTAVTREATYETTYTNNYQYQPETTTEKYTYSSYNANIDPDLMADLNKNN